MITEKTVHPLNSLSWDRLLGSTPARFSPDDDLCVNTRGKRVLVTGAAGCIGSALACAIALGRPEQLVLIDASEHGLYELERSWARKPELARAVTILGSVADRDLVSAVFQQYRPQIVFHAAAFKQVPLTERNPFAAIANNAVATYDLTLAATTYGCEQMVLISTDKAADPLSIMGASKRIAELAVLTSHPGNARNRAVRLGNVLGSTGSVVPLFLHQIASGEPLTVTHPDASRYFMVVDEAVAALLAATSLKYPTGLFVPALRPPVRIQDLAASLIAESDPLLRDKARIVFTTLRPGDKIVERLISKRERWEDPAHLAQRDGSLGRVVSPQIPMANFAAALEELRDAVKSRDMDRMIDTILLLVPEYQPSAMIAAHRCLPARTRSGVRS
jgi:FlaA1/EpsC-like NDP-sugar epimerase